MKMPRNRVTGRRSVRGFSLTELMVALAIGLTIMMALSILFFRNSRNQGELERTLRQLESARFSLDTLAEDVMHAGYYSDFSPLQLPTAPTFTTPGACPAAIADLGWDAAATPPNIPVPVQGIAEGGTNPACLADRDTAVTEALILRHAETGPAISSGASKAGNLYIQVSGCDQEIVANKSIYVLEGGGTFDLRRPDCSTVNDAVRRWVQRTYYVASCNDCAAKDGIPTLKRVEWVDGAMQTISIAEGVENIQMEYGLDTAGSDGQPDTFVNVGGVADWTQVVALRLHLLVRSTEITQGYVDARTYQVGPDVTVTKPADGYKRTVMTTTVRLNNVGGRREK
jgi:type IV pilus assembly protein PilW